jgi:hypothetical protein
MDSFSSKTPKIEFSLELNLVQKVINFSLGREWSYRTTWTYHPRIVGWIPCGRIETYDGWCFVWFLFIGWQNVWNSRFSCWLPSCLESFFVSLPTSHGHNAGMLWILFHLGDRYMHTCSRMWMVLIVPIPHLVTSTVNEEVMEVHLLLVWQKKFPIHPILHWRALGWCMIGVWIDTHGAQAMTRCVHNSFAFLPRLFTVHSLMFLDRSMEHMNPRPLARELARIFWFSQTHPKQTFAVLCHGGEQLDRTVLNLTTRKTLWKLTWIHNGPRYKKGDW